MWISNIIDAILPYKGYIALAIGWIAHIYIPHLIRVYPFVSMNGGVFGLVCNFFFGVKTPVVPTPSITVPPTNP